MIYNIYYNIIIYYMYIYIIYDVYRYIFLMFRWNFKFIIFCRIGVWLHLLHTLPSGIYTYRYDLPSDFSHPGLILPLSQPFNKE